jgi:uncharacterized protein YcbX
MSAYLARIVVFPFKSLDGMPLDSAVVLPSGALEGDRRWALADHQGTLLTAKRCTSLHGIRFRFDPATRMVYVQAASDGNSAAFHIDQQRRPLQSWFSDVLGQTVQIIEDSNGGFPDDVAASGPTVVSTATLQAVAGWFPPLDEDDVRQRFRANLELGGVEPFWEDRLVGTPEQPVWFRVGDCVLGGVNCCQRCAVPSRDPKSGQALAGFVARFARYRESALPPWAARDRFDHYYRLCVNTRPGGSPYARLRVGDPVELVDAPAAGDACR